MNPIWFQSSFSSMCKHGCISNSVYWHIIPKVFMTILSSSRWQVTPPPFSLGFQPLRIEEEGSGDNAIPVLCRCPECGHGQSARCMGNHVTFKNEYRYQAHFQITVSMGFYAIVVVGSYLVAVCNIVYRKYIGIILVWCCPQTLPPLREGAATPAYPPLPTPVLMHVARPK